VPLILVLRRAVVLPASEIAALALVLPLSIAVAWVSWVVVEKPAIAWAKRRGERRGQSASAAGSPAAARARA
jgi:peptidoglycan/LPS O-acetylase OafA/YrhL